MSNRVPAAGCRVRLAGTDLAGYVLLASAVPAHPRRTRGHVLVECSRPTLMIETLLPAGNYSPGDVIRVELIPSDTMTSCACERQAW